MKRLLIYILGMIGFTGISCTLASKETNMIFIRSNNANYSMYNCGGWYSVDTVYNMRVAWFGKILLESLGPDTCYNIFKRYYEVKRRRGMRSILYPFFLLRVIHGKFDTLCVPARGCNKEFLREMLLDSAHWEKISHRVEQGPFIDVLKYCESDSSAKAQFQSFSYTFKLDSYPVLDITRIDSMPKDEFLKWYEARLDSTLNMNVKYKLKCDGPTHDSREHPLPLFKKRK